MVYKYKRKTNQAKWSEDIMMIAIADCNAGIPVKTTSKKYGLPYATLYRHWKKGSSTVQLGRFRKVFNDQQEGDLQTYLQEMDSIFYGLTREDFKALVYVYAKKNNLTYPQSWDRNEKAGDDWLAGFMSRNPQITLRVPEATSIARIKGFNRLQVERFYELLSNQTEKYSIDGTRIYNVDETGIQTSTNKPPKVLSVKGKKQVGIISSTERGQTTTIVCCCNAAGSFLPPFMIFARKRMQERLLDGSPPETRGTYSSSGWITGEIFLEWLKFFVGHVRPTADKKVLLILDNHESHKHYPVLEYASQNNVIILSLPPHTSNKLQPLDVAVYGALKIYFEQEINRFQKAHPGRVVNQYDVARLFAPAYLKCASPNNAIKGFKSTGIWPINMDLWEEKDFAPSSTTMTTHNITNSEITLQETINEDVATTAINNHIRPSTSGLQSSLGPSKTLENIPDVSSSDDEQVHMARKENIDLQKNSVFCRESIEPRGVSPSIISELYEEDPLKSILASPRYFTPEKGGTSTDHLNSIILNATVDQQHSALSIETVSLPEISHTTPPSIIRKPHEKDNFTIDVCDSKRPMSCTPGILDIYNGHGNLAIQDSETEQNRSLASKIYSTLPSNISNEEDPLKYLPSIVPNPYLSPREIKPLPSPHVPIGTRKRKLQKSEVLTSTPVKEEQKAKFVKANNKVLKNMNKDSNIKVKTTLEKKTNTTKNTKATKDMKTTKGVKTTKNTKFKKSKDYENDENYICFFCGEDYIEVNGQPVDDWVQCNSCKQWSHEKCTAYEGRGMFFCDNCTNW